MILRVIWWWWWSEASGAMIDSIPLLSRQSTRRMLPKMGSYLVVLFTELVEDYVVPTYWWWEPEHMYHLTAMKWYNMPWIFSNAARGHVSRHPLCEPRNPLSWLRIHCIQSLNPFFHNNKTQKIEILDGFVLGFLLSSILLSIHLCSIY